MQAINVVKYVSTIKRRDVFIMRSYTSFIFWQRAFLHTMALLPCLKMTFKMRTASEMKTSPKMKTTLKRRQYQNLAYTL